MTQEIEVKGEDILGANWKRERDTIKAATTRLNNWLNTPAHVLDERHYIMSTNQEADSAHAFIRMNLDLQGQDPLNDSHWDEDYPSLTKENAQKILTDLAIIWDDEFSREWFSQIAIQLSLCPMHFGDWAGCFDDEDPECAQIRAIFPYGHDT